jgi:hypothetical protein
MRTPLLVKYIVPFMLWYGLMIVATIIIDLLLHYFKMVYIGRALGYIGTGFILLSFIYSLRKRKIIKSGSPKKLLNLHEYLAWAGSVMILVHAGIHFNAILPWLAILALLINVASGLIGKFLLKRAAESLNESRTAYINAGLSKLEADDKLHFDILTLGALKQWRIVHLPITFLLAALSIIHIISIFIF